MLTWLLQDLLVTSIAVAAAAVLVRRVTGAIAPSRGEQACSSCPSCPASKSVAPPERLIHITTRDDAGRA